MLKTTFPLLLLFLNISQLLGVVSISTFSSLCLHSLVFLRDLILLNLFLAGLYFCFKRLTDQNIFMILYGLTSIYFAGVMVRLMLVLAPIMCILGGIAVSNTIANYIGNMELFGASEKEKTKSGRQADSAATGKAATKGGKHKEDNYPYKQEVEGFCSLLKYGEF